MKDIDNGSEDFIYLKDEIIRMTMRAEEEAANIISASQYVTMLREQDARNKNPLIKKAIIQKAERAWTVMEDSIKQENYLNGLAVGLGCAAALLAGYVNVQKVERRTYER